MRSATRPADVPRDQINRTSAAHDPGGVLSRRAGARDTPLPGKGRGGGSPRIRGGHDHAGFVIADVRGYTRFTRERGDASAAALAKKFADLSRDAVEARGGRVLELRGDEALAVFESPAQAVRAALELQETCAEESRSDPDLPLPVGMGSTRERPFPSRRAIAAGL